MNAGAEFRLSMMYDIYSAICNIRDRNYNEWVRMTESQLVHEVMLETRGICPPHVVREVIRDLAKQ
jgi:hypothetical protein